MKQFRVAAVLLGSALSMAALLLACSDDDTVVPPPDAGDDTGKPDTGRPDTGADTGRDTGTDTGSDASDAGDASDAEPDVLIDAGMTFATFQAELAETECRTIARCCFGDANLPGDGGVDASVYGDGVYDEEKCKAYARSSGFEASLLYSDMEGGAPLVLNQAAAQRCLTKVGALSCVLGRAEFAAVRADCFNAVRGTRNAGESCVSFIDCVPGTFCNGTTKKCEALRGEDGGCGGFNDLPGIVGASADHACTWRGSGDTDRYCDTYDWVNGTFKPESEWRCRKALPNGEFCNNSLSCTAGLCDLTDTDSDGSEDFVCRASVVYYPPTPTFCGELVKQP